MIPLNTNADFSGGKYTLSISSCGNRESFEILINGESVGSISRSGTGFGMDQMTVDKLDVVLELYADDIVTVVASADGYGWVDYLQLDKYISADATESGDGYFVYQMEYFYDGNICEDIAADLQPGESILFRLNTNQDFTAGRYRLTVYSCGNRESFDILVNGRKICRIESKSELFSDSYEMMMFDESMEELAVTLAVICDQVSDKEEKARSSADE